MIRLYEIKTFLKWSLNAIFFYKNDVKSGVCLFLSFTAPAETRQVACLCVSKGGESQGQKCACNGRPTRALSLCLPGQIFIFLQPPSCRPAALFKNAQP